MSNLKQKAKNRAANRVARRLAMQKSKLASELYSAKMVNVGAIFNLAGAFSTDEALKKYSGDYKGHSFFQQYFDENLADVNSTVAGNAFQVNTMIDEVVPLLKKYLSEPSQLNLIEFVLNPIIFEHCVQHFQDDVFEKENESCDGMQVLNWLRALLQTTDPTLLRGVGHLLPADAVQVLGVASNADAQGAPGGAQ